MARKKSAAKKAKALENESIQTAVEKKVEENISNVASDSDQDTTSSSDEEDEFGELITADVEDGIQKVLSTIRSDPEKLLDKNVKFFDDENSLSEANEKIEKPMYLKDYHRMNLLSGGYKEDDESSMTVDGEKPFVTTQREERESLISDIKNAFEDQSEDEFTLKKKEPTVAEEVTVLPDTKNEAEFLDAFFDQQAWIPKKNDKVLDLDQINQEDEQEFDDAVEDFEKAYNFRYEDPNSAEIVSYARSQATLRRSATNSRKRQRDKKRELKEKEQEEKSQAIKKKKTSKLNKLMDRLSAIKEAVGDDVSNETIEKVFGDSLLNDDFNDADWDAKMSEIFNSKYYESENVKPEWDDEIMEEFNNKKNGIESNSSDIDTETNGVENNKPDLDESASKKSKKEKIKDKKSVKKEKEQLRKQAEDILESNVTKIVDEVEEERGRNADSEIRFKYREVSPESFGLTTRDILIADDKDLNSLIGIKKFAPYRPRELRMKDKRKLTKSKQVQKWRKEVSKKYKKQGIPEDDEKDVWVPIDSGEGK